MAMEQPAPVMVTPPPTGGVCMISQEAMIMYNMTQNRGRAMPSPCSTGWWERISLSGGINVDVGKWGNRNTNYMGENYQRLSLNDAYLNIGACITDWAKAFVSISYNDATINDVFEATPGNHVFEYNAAYANNVRAGAINQIQLEQAFFTVGNFDMSPVFLQLGKQYQDFGRYELHPITESMTQVMSKTLATSVKLGFIASGFNGAVYVFDDPLKKIGQSSTTTNYGVALGYDQPSDQFGFDLGVAYLYNLIGVNDIAYAVNQFNLNNNNILNQGYNSRVGGVAAYADINSGPFTLAVRYTTAVQRFNVNDLPKNGVGGVNVNTGIPLVNQTAAKPWSVGVDVAYGFNNWFCRNQSVYVGYQGSHEASGLGLPKSRWLVGYDIEVYKNTNFGVEWDHDTPYRGRNGSRNHNSNLVSLRGGVKFG